MTEIETKGLPVAIYARVSSEEQKEGQTIDSQIAELESYAKSRTWNVAAIFKDEGWSGTIMARPALDQLRDNAGKGLIKAVLINDVDRLARDVTHLGVLKRDLEKQGVAVVFRKLPGEKSPTQSLMINILGSFAEFEREMILDRTRRGRRHKIEVRKEYLGSRPPYGFRYVPKDQATGQGGQLHIIPEEAKIVRQMYTWVAEEGLSARKVLGRLNERRVIPKKGGSSWARSSVGRILRSEVYAGVWHYNKHRRAEPRSRSAGSDRYRKSMKSSTRRRPKEEWIPLELPESLHIVNRNLWERVQSQLDRNRTFSPRHSKHNYLLRGLIRCGDCRATYVGDPGKGTYSYRCANRCKAHPSIREERLNQVVWGAVETEVLNPEILLKQATKYRKKKKRSRDQERKIEFSADAELRTLKTEEERIIDAYRTSAIDAIQLGRQLEKLGARRQTLQARQAETRSPERQTARIQKSVQDYCRLAAKRIRTFTREERQRFLRLLLTEITFLGDHIRIQGHIPIGSSSQKGREGSLKQAGIAAPSLNRRGRNLALEFCLTEGILQGGKAGEETKSQ